MDVFRKKRYGEPSALDVISFDSTNEINKREFNNFNIKNNHLLDNDNYYNELTYDFINEDKTSFEDFKNVLLKDFNSHDSKIHFICSNYLAREIVFSFKRKFKGSINITNAGKSNKFISSDGNPISQTNFSNSKTTSDIISNDILELLK